MGDWHIMLSRRRNKVSEIARHSASRRPSGSVAEIVFGLDGRLRRGDEVVASVDDGNPGTFARVTVSHVEYDIVRTKRFGWHLALVRASSGSPVCQYVPSRIRRGGRLYSGDAITRLRARWLGGRQWYFLSQDGHRISAQARTGRQRTRGESPGMEVHLYEGHGSTDMTLHDLLVLVLGCWLIVQWEAAPTQPVSNPPILFDIFD
jgi:hypothetical protein